MAFVSHAPTILVFDSGLGGLTVFREIVKLRKGTGQTTIIDKPVTQPAAPVRDRREVMRGGGPF